MTTEKLKALLKELSLEEKIGEISQIEGRFFDPDSETTGEETTGISAEDIRLCGSTLNVFDPVQICEIQKRHMENHPHHIPMVFMGDIIHGYSTIYPIPLAQGCSFDPELIKNIAEHTAREASVSGLHITFSPMVDVVRDPRWGRVMESYGEDTYLNSCMAAAAVHGYQGEDIKKENTLGACVKHFAAYGAIEGGREYGVVDMSERRLRQEYLPPYKAACDAGSLTLMTAFNAVSGVPASGSQQLLQDILRKEWNWQGAVISDYTSIYLMKSHGISLSEKDLAKIAAECRLDIEMCSRCYHNGIRELLSENLISQEQLDILVYDVLNLKNRLGLFENPTRFADAQKAKAVINSRELLAFAREKVPQTSVLLQNHAKILPLDSASVQDTAFIGPYLNERRILGRWVIGNLKRMETQTVAEALDHRFGLADSQMTQGCRILGIEQQKEAEFHHDTENLDIADREAHIAKAVELAKSKGRVVLFLGEHCESGGELSSRAYIKLPDIQLELLRRVSEVNPNVVTVLFNHRPLELGEICRYSKAVLDVWFPGTMGSEAIVDMLYGISAPTGRLSMSFPVSVGQIPVYYNHLPTDHSCEYQGRFVTGYIDCENDPLFAFGQGLTYTEFTYGEVELDRDSMTAGETITAAVTVTNTGDRDGWETVQLYLRDMEASVSRPMKELKGFQKVFIRKGESVRITLPVEEPMLRFYNDKMECVSEPGLFRLFIGHDSTVKPYREFHLQ